ncbi:MAG: hypothetical protein CMK06_02170 [Ponticaulis sp.]|nr:hypothetical protein [Ponticaulis sp.]
MPKQGEEMLAVFNTDVDGEILVRTAKARGLEVVSFDDRFRHLIVKDTTGTSSKALYAMGASYVLDADFALFCNSSSPSPRNVIS